MPLAASPTSQTPLPPVPTSQTRRSSESALAKKLQGLENPSFSHASMKQDSRYAQPSFSAKPAQENRYVYAFPSTRLPPRPSVSPPPPNMPPPAYTPSAQPGKKIPPRQPSMDPSATYTGRSVVYNRGGSTASYGGYERPRPYGKHVSIHNYEEINDLESNGYAEIGGPM